MKNKNILVLAAILAAAGFTVSQAVLASPPGPPPTGVANATFNSVTVTPASGVGLKVTGAAGSDAVTATGGISADKIYNPSGTMTIGPGANYNSADFTGGNYIYPSQPLSNYYTKAITGAYTATNCADQGGLPNGATCWFPVMIYDDLAVGTNISGTQRQNNLVVDWAGNIYNPGTYNSGRIALRDNDGVDVYGPIQNPTGSAVAVNDSMTVNGGGSNNVDLNVTGRIRTGDASNLGGVWLGPVGSQQFVGQEDPTTVGFYNNGWSLGIDASGNISNPGSQPLKFNDTDGNTFTSDGAGVGFAKTMTVAATGSSGVAISATSTYGNAISGTAGAAGGGIGVAGGSTGGSGVAGNGSGEGGTGVTGTSTSVGINNAQSGLFFNGTNTVKLAGKKAGAAYGIDTDGPITATSVATGMNSTITANLPAGYNGNGITGSVANASSYAIYASNSAGGTAFYGVGVNKSSTSTAWTIASDARLKDVQGEFKTGLDAILKLNPIKFNYKKNNAENIPSDKTIVGLIAQEVQKVIPEAITTDAQGYLQMNTDPIIWTMLNAIKELNGNMNEQVAELKNENAQLKAKDDELTARLDKLETQVARLQK